MSRNEYRRLTLPPQQCPLLVLNMGLFNSFGFVCGCMSLDTSAGGIDITGVRNSG
jgi:hypothetical protein